MTAVEFPSDVCRWAGVGDNERRPDVVSTGHAQRRRRRCSLRRRPHPGVSVVIVTVPASGHCFYGDAEVEGTENT